VHPKRWNVTQFHDLRGQPWLENCRLVLVEGDILEFSRESPRDDAALGVVQESLRIAFGNGYCVRARMALVLGLSTDPVPDIAVVAGSPRDYKDHPRTALLVVEIAESSLAYDTREKANLYAAGGILDYWVVDLVQRQLIVFRDPARDVVQMYGAAYRSRDTYDASIAVSPLAAPQTQIRVGDLLP
jgi:Uma2 family endonuclease